jgi:queuine tRNA-ribosyltransferase
MLTPLEKLNDSPTYRNIAVNLDEKSVDNVLSVLKQFKESNKTSKIYVFGELTLSQCGELRECGIDFIETSSMLHDAANGRLQLEEGTLDITSAKWANDHTSLDISCSCYTCRSHTLAYLHHLTSFTPLLAMKLHAIHNVYKWTKSMAFH